METGEAGVVGMVDAEKVAVEGTLGEDPPAEVGAEAAEVAPGTSGEDSLAEVAPVTLGEDSPAEVAPVT